jgi:uncharacterized membrane protein
MSMGPNPYAPGAGGMGGGAPPEDLVKKAGNIQLMGILSIVFAFCCGCVGIVLSIIVLVQAGGVTTALAQYGSPPELMSKVSTGKMCAIIGLVLTVIMMILGVVINLAQLAAVQQQG